MFLRPNDKLPPPLPPTQMLEQWVHLIPGVLFQHRGNLQSHTPWVRSCWRAILSFYLSSVLSVRPTPQISDIQMLQSPLRGHGMTSSPFKDVCTDVKCWRTVVFWSLWDAFKPKLLWLMLTHTRRDRKITSEHRFACICIQDIPRCEM